MWMYMIITCAIARQYNKNEKKSRLREITTIYLPLIALILPYMPYSPYICIIILRLHLCAKFRVIGPLFMEISHLKLCDLNLTFKGHTS